MSCSKINLSLLNGHLICGLCGGYLIDATVLTNCIHAFCRSCILKYILMENKVCPLCQTLINLQPGRPGYALRPDVTLQRVVYKLVPGLLRIELDRIAEFEQRFAKNPSKVLKNVNIYHQITKEAFSSFDGSSKSDKFGSCLSSPTPTALATRSLSRSMSLPTRNSRQLAPSSSLHSLFPEESYSCLIDTKESVSISLTRVSDYTSSGDLTDLDSEGDTLYFLCPSSSTVAHLQRLLLAKHTLTTSAATAVSVDVYLGLECLEPAHSLRELAYLYAWPTHRLILPLKFRFADLGMAWWGSPMPRLEAPILSPDPSSPSSFSDCMKRKRTS